MKIGAIIQARTSLTRLFGKIIKEFSYSYESICCYRLIASNKVTEYIYTIK